MALLTEGRELPAEVVRYEIFPHARARTDAKTRARLRCVCRWARDADHEFVVPADVTPACVRARFVRESGRELDYVAEPVRLRCLTRVDRAVLAFLDVIAQCGDHAGVGPFLRYVQQFALVRVSWMPRSGKYTLTPFRLTSAEIGSVKLTLQQRQVPYDALYVTYAVEAAEQLWTIQSLVLYADEPVEFAALRDALATPSFAGDLADKRGGGGGGGNARKE